MSVPQEVVLGLEARQAIYLALSLAADVLDGMTPATTEECEEAATVVNQAMGLLREAWPP